MAIGGLSAYGYLEVESSSSAVAAVAVVEPAVTRASTSQQAQVTFSSVAESYRVAERVIRKLGLEMEPRDLKNSVSVKLARSLVPNLSAPLYLVEVTHRDAQVAVTLANAVVDEAKQVFTDLNAVDPTQVDATFSAEDARLRAELEDARKALRELEDANEAWMLPSLLNSHLAVLTGLQQGDYALNSNKSASAALRTEIQRSLATAQAEQARLRSLQPEYERLALEVSLAVSGVSQDSSRLRDVALSGDSGLQSAVQHQLNTVKSQLDQAREALTTFQRNNRIGDLPTDLAVQSSTVTDLRRQLIMLNAGDGDPQEAQAIEREEVRRLAALMPQYDALYARITAAQGQLALLMNRKLDLVINGVVNPSTQVKVLDTAQVEPQVFWQFIIQALGIVLGLFAGLVVVYLLAYFDRTPRTSEDVEELLGFPVLARLPKAR